MNVMVDLRDIEVYMLGYGAAGQGQQSEGEAHPADEEVVLGLRGVYAGTMNWLLSG